MTDKEFKRLGRAQLIDIIYQLQLQVDTLTEQNQALEKDLQDKRLRISRAGNLAEAALEINNCFQTAQAAAEQYLEEIRQMDAEREKILSDARAEAAQIIANAKKVHANDESLWREIELDHAVLGDAR